MILFIGIRRIEMEEGGREGMSLDEREVMEEEKERKEIRAEWCKNGASQSIHTGGRSRYEQLAIKGRGNGGCVEKN